MQTLQTQLRNEKSSALRSFCATANVFAEVKEMKRKLIRYSTTAVTCAIISLLILWAKGTFEQTRLSAIYRDLSDAFFASGAVTLCVGLLICMNNGGAFRMLSYGFIRLIDRFRRDLTKVKYRTFYDYNEAKKDHKSEFLYLVIVGAVFVVVAVVFLLLYQKVV